ncbi:MAG: LmeA family phospholipid-binding protein [Rhizobacter sp.]|nr:LmeA family phospholipid-binding protein [Rhizobacter sp.]
MALSRSVAVVALLIAACGSVLDERAASALREALSRAVGPAASYDVEVSGASLDASRFERVQVVGRRVAREHAPIVDRVELELDRAVIDRAQKRLVALADSRGELRVRADDLTAFLRASRWIDAPSVALAAPDRLRVVGRPRLAGVAVAGGDIEIDGRLVAAGAELRLALDGIRVGNATASPLVRSLVEAAVNPLFDASAHPLPARIDAVDVDAQSVRIRASGSRLPPP